MCFYFYCLHSFQSDYFLHYIFIWFSLIHFIAQYILRTLLSTDLNENQNIKLNEIVSVNTLAGVVAFFSFLFFSLRSELWNTEYNCQLLFCFSFFFFHFFHVFWLMLWDCISLEFKVFGSFQFIVPFFHWFSSGQSFRIFKQTRNNWFAHSLNYNSINKELALIWKVSNYKRKRKLNYTDNQINSRILILS